MRVLARAADYRNAEHSGQAFAGPRLFVSSAHRVTGPGARGSRIAMPSRRHYTIGNWKMNGRSPAAQSLAAAIRSGAPGGRTTLVVCPPATLLVPVANVLAGGPVLLGGQDCHVREAGAFTGDIAAEMLADAGCRFAIVGHSERRAGHGEDDAMVGAKAAAALRAGLIPVLCIGETLDQRESGMTREVLNRQIAGGLPPGADPATLVLAYEPVWAIGTGRVATPDQVAEAHGWIRAALESAAGRSASYSILYGGSVKPENAAALFALDDVDGALVGGASLVATQFLAIAAAAGPA